MKKYILKGHMVTKIYFEKEMEANSMEKVEELANSISVSERESWIVKTEILDHDLQLEEIHK